MVEELAFALSPQALYKLLAPGLIRLTSAGEDQFWYAYYHLSESKGEPSWAISAADLFGETLTQSALATLRGLPLTDEGLLAMPLPEFQQLLEEHWVAELELPGTP